MQKTILVLGTGQAQLDLVEHCRDVGMSVFGCSNYSGDVAERHLDGFALIDIADVDKVKLYAKQIHADVVYSIGSDIAMPTACKTSEELGLPCFVSSSTAYLCNTKNELRDFLGNEFPGNVRHTIAVSKNDPITLQYPLIMKPVDSQGQRGVREISSIEQFRELFDDTLSFSRKKKIIVEEYVTGPEISVNTYSAKGEVIFFAITDRTTWPHHPGGIIHEHLVPSVSTNTEIHANIKLLATHVLEMLSIENGPAYFQIKLHGGTIPKLIEVAPRLDGCHLWRLLKYYTGIDILEMTIQHLCGNSPAVPVETTGTGSFKLEFLCERPATTFSRSKYDVADALFTQWYYQEGEVVKRMNGFMEKGGYTIKRTGTEHNAQTSFSDKGYAHTI
jgi:biotin carboxylase